MHFLPTNRTRIMVLYKPSFTHQSINVFSLSFQIVQKLQTNLTTLRYF
ncbi:hypothetical protein X975_25378, partial [Stegodyphus mimosarum]